ncbi:hypothetical protein MSPP1_000497 [Malassezia sp. CBS 17886]|nr:hypothetical protein MSPP1_000497 [Malassezia sp. CBS 17886]
MASADPVYSASARICNHMNSDHADAVSHLAMYHGGLPQLPQSAMLVSISGTGMDIQLDGGAWTKQLVVVTGGANGLGAVLVQRLAEKGARVIVLDVVKAKHKHQNVSVYHCDVSKQSNIVSVSRSILSHHGEPTMLINNAAVRNGRPLLALTETDIAKVFDTGLLAHFWMLKEFLPSMAAKNSGHIVTVSSMMGLTGVAQMVDYVAAKHALVGMHDSLRHELDAIYRTPFVRTTLVTTGHLEDTTMFSGVQYNAFARFVAPVVSTEHIADALLDALENQESRTVALPWYVALIPLMRMVPSFALGANHAMSSIAPAPSAPQ